MCAIRSSSAPIPGRLAIIAGLCALLPAIAQAQVVYFQRPPTPEQLRAALLAPGAAPAASAAAPQRGAPAAGSSRTRGIVWQAAGSTAPSAPATAPQPYQPSSAMPGYQPAAQAAPVQTMAITTAAAPSHPPGSALMEPAGNGSGSGSPAAALPINFDSGSSRIDRDSMPYIESIASLMRSDPSLQLVIEGHTDARGAYNRNMLLSWDRALGVFRTLVETYGVEPRRLQPVGKGPLEPMPGTDPVDGSNRRVQFRIPG